MRNFCCGSTFDIDGNLLVLYTGTVLQEVVESVVKRETIMELIFLIMYRQIFYV